MDDIDIDSDSSHNHSPNHISSQTSHHTMSMSTVDSSDPLFLHASDHPGMILVPKVLDGTNYAMWKRSMLVSLSAKKQTGIH